MADFYGTLAAALTYHAERGNAAWAASTDPLRTAALVRASAYIDGAYRASFPGYKTGRRDQVLEWPRTDAWDGAGEPIPSDEVPVEIENAAYEGALRELASPGALAPDVVAGGGGIKREKVGPLETEYFSNGSTQATFTAIRLALGGLLNLGSAYSGSVVRA